MATSLPRMRRLAAAGAAALACVLGTGVAAAQSASAAPALTRAQRAALGAAVAAVDRPDTSVAGRWQHHVLRASDGSHYVAVTVDVPATAPPPPSGVVLYIRLTPRVTGATAASTSSPLRSAVAEWLAGARATPLAIQPTRMMGVQRGEMPIGGTQAMVGRGDSIAAAESSVSLRMLMRDRERAREREDQEAARRRAVLDGREAATSFMLPFEDFDVRALPVAGTAGTWRFTRAVVAGPGEADLTLAWAAPGSRPLVAQQVTLRLSLPPTSADRFDLSAPILASALSLRDAPYPPDQQAAHPYAVGPLDITPAEDESLTNTERLAVVWQALNPTAGPDGKPDVSIALRLYLQTETGPRQAAVLSNLTYDARTLPPDFDLRTGQPLFVAMTAPLAGLPRGRYALRAQAVDRLSRATVTHDVAFTIAATRTSLLAEAPAPLWPFRRESMLGPSTLGPLLTRLETHATTDGMRRLLAASRHGAFVEVLAAAETSGMDASARDAPLPQWLRLLARFALGDTTASIAGPLQQADRWTGPLAGPARWLLGAAQAAGGSDRDALVSWQAAVDAGVPAGALALPMADAALRLRQPDRVATLAARAPAEDAVRAATVKAAALLQGGRYAEAAATLARIDPSTQAAGDTAPPDAAFLRLHAWFGMLAAPSAPPDTTLVAQFTAAAEAYLNTGGPQAALVREWRDIVVH